jgi:hypothetical protein
VQALLRRRHSLHVISSAQERVLDPATPEWVGFHDEDGHWFEMLLILRHLLHAPDLEMAVISVRPTIEYLHDLNASVAVLCSCLNVVSVESLFKLTFIVCSSDPSDRHEIERRLSSIEIQHTFHVSIIEGAEHHRTEL